MELLQYLKLDEELKELRLKWKEAYSTPFPPYNWDEYAGIEDYKNQIREKLKSTTSQYGMLPVKRTMKNREYPKVCVNLQTDVR